MTPHIHRISTAALARIRRPRPVYKPLPPPEKYSAFQVICWICHKAGVKTAEILSENKRRDLVMVRFVIAHYLREECKLTLTQIASAMNRKNHATIVHYLNQYNNLTETKHKEFVSLLETVNDVIGG